MKRYRYTLSLGILLLMLLVLFPGQIFADPASTNYIFKDYSFGASSGETKSTNYSQLGTAGEGISGNSSSANYSLRDGISFTLNANTPPAPTLTNGSNTYYNKLNITLATGSNPTDTQFAIAISPDAFASTTNYVQADNTIGATAVWQTNTLWGASGFTIIGLTPGTTYTVKVAAKQGNYSMSEFGPTAALATANPTISFSFSPTSINIGQLNPTTVVTSGSVTTSVSTNGTGGAITYVYDSNAGLMSPGTSYTISAVSNDLSTTSEGYGVRGSSVTQSSGGPMEIASPYNGTGNVVGILDTTKRILFDSTNAPVVSGQGVFEFKAKASATAKAATDYTDTLTVLTSATF